MDSRLQQAQQHQQPRYLNTPGDSLILGTAWTGNGKKAVQAQCGHSTGSHEAEGGRLEAGDMETVVEN